LRIGSFLVVAIKTIPRNAAGKIQRAQLKEAIAERLRRL
jgi:acyl-coenzyme A synthetase/AMP-(fatty) acid ligase